MSEPDHIYSAPICRGCHFHKSAPAWHRRGRLKDRVCEIYAAGMRTDNGPCLWQLLSLGHTSHQPQRFTARSCKCRSTAVRCRQSGGRTCRRRPPLSLHRAARTPPRHSTPLYRSPRLELNAAIYESRFFIMPRANYASFANFAESPPQCLRVWGSGNVKFRFHRSIDIEPPWHGGRFQGALSVIGPRFDDSIVIPGDKKLHLFINFHKFHLSRLI